MTLITRFERFDPFADLTAMRNQFDRLMARFDPEVEEEALTTEWAPTSDVMETRDAIIIRAELPGLTEKDVKVEMENGVLTLRGERKLEKEITDKGYRHIERTYGKFIRSFTMPPNVDFSKVAANFNNGLLEVEIPKKEEAKPKTINVEVKKKLPVAA